MSLGGGPSGSPPVRPSEEGRPLVGERGQWTPVYSSPPRSFPGPTREDKDTTPTHSFRSLVSGRRRLRDLRFLTPGRSPVNPCFFPSSSASILTGDLSPARSEREFVPGTPSPPRGGPTGNPRPPGSEHKPVISVSFAVGQFGGDGKKEKTLTDPNFRHEHKYRESDAD